MKVILDSNIFDDLLRDQLSVDLLNTSGIVIFITHVQIDEINNCPDADRRAKLFLRMTELRPKKIATESFVIGSSRIGSAKIGDGKLISELRNGNLKNTNDALIGETAIKNGLTLISNDKSLINKVISLGGKACTLGDLSSLVQ